MNQWQVAWRNLMRRKLRTLLTIISIVIGVASTFAVLTAVDSAKKALPVYLQESFAKADFTIAGTDAYFSEKVMNEMEEPENFTAVAMVKENTKLSVDRKDITSIQKRVVITGYSRMDTSVTGFKLVEGDLTADGAVITDRSAEVWDAKLGDTLTFDTENGEKSVAVTAIVKYTRDLMGPSSWNMAKYHHWAVAMPLPMVQDWFDIDNQIQSIQIKADGALPLEEVEHKIDHLVQDNGEIYAQPVVINFDTESQDLSTFYTALYIAGFLGIALSAFIIFNSIYVSIKERKNEFAVLKTIGYTPGQIQAMVLMEVFLLAIIGTIFGLVIGYGMAVGLKSLIFMLYGIQSKGEMVISVGITVSLIAGLLVPVITSWYPIRQLGNVSVINMLKENRTNNPGLNQAMLIIGVLLITSSFFIKHLLLVVPLMAGIAFIFPYLFKLFILLAKGTYRLIFRFSGDIAMRNLNRNLSRTSMTSVILCLGIAMIVLMSSLNSAILQTYERVIHASYGGNLDVMFHHIEEGDLDIVKSTDGVADAQSYSLQSIIWTLNGEKRMLPIYGVGEEWIDRFPLFAGSNGSQSKLVQTLQHDEIILDKISFDVWGGRIGETITLDTLDGERSFKVIDVVNTMKNSGYAGFIKEESFKDNFGIKYERNILVVKDEQTSPLQLRENIYGQFGERVEEMWGPEDWVSVIGSVITSSFSIINALVILAIAISGIGITNTLLINIMERIREIGMMRAVGITRRQIINMILVEGLGIGLAATVIGILCGIILIYNASGFVEINSLTFEFGVSGMIVALIFSFGILVSLLASLIPSKKAAKIPLNEALRYE